MESGARRRVASRQGLNIYKFSKSDFEYGHPYIFFLMQILIQQKSSVRQYELIGTIVDAVGQIYIVKWAIFIDRNIEYTKHMLCGD